MKRWIILAMWATAFTAVVGTVAWWHLSIWDECRATNGFWYCVRVLSR